MSFSGYPASMRFIFNKLQGFARNRVKLPVLAPQTATHGDLIVFEIGANQKVDLSTLTFGFTCTTTATGGTTPTAVPPKFTQCLIQQLSVDVNGVNVCNIDQYNHLWHLLASYQAGDYERKATLAEWGRNITTATNSTVLTNVPLMMKNFLGFLGNGKVIDTGITGPIRLTMRLGPSTSMLLSGTGLPTAFTFSMTNMHFSYDVVTIDDGIYDNMIAQRLAGGDVIPICFTNYQAFLGNTGGIDGLTNRVPCNVQSLDYVLHTILPNDYNSITANKCYTLTNETSYYFSKGDIAEKLTACQLQVGSTYIPNYRHSNPVEMYAQTMDALNLSNDMVGTVAERFAGSVNAGAAISGNAIAQRYVNGYFLFAAKLCANSGQYEVGQSLLSGLDTRGANTLISATTFADSGAGSGFPLTYLVFTSTLNVGAHRQLQLIM